MIDPHAAVQTLTHAALLWVPLDSSSCFLSDATPAQLDAIRASRSRNPTVQAAKKALRATALLEELKVDLDGLPSVGAAPAALRAAPAKAPAASPSDPASLAIVPFIKTVRPETVVDNAQAMHRPVHARFKLPASFPQLYRKAFERAVNIMAFLPLALVYVGLFYTLLGFAYLAAHPELLVRAAFSLLDAIPNYTAFATEQMWNQVKLEMADRFR